MATEDYVFCMYCGTKNEALDGSFVGSATSKINEWTGGEGAVKVSLGDFFNFKFLRFYLVAVLIHATWKWTNLESLGYIRYIVLAIITWTVVLVLIHAGLRELQLKLEKNGKKEEGKQVEN